MKTIENLSAFALNENKTKTIKGGAERTWIRFWNDGTGRVTVTVFNDVNGNGVFDFGDKIISTRTSYYQQEK
ncbi:hypothetical protein [Chryseobacterium shigense]|uniref:Uncharacterized protein n=1 Tax=Chryseobacterium shigense TaxID=297244 RepID=A0A841MZ00_9FLAO|nr:hypothetical protein [Chryseobacterium shigense]MBB6369774.1 hypothetical protein [Chryseobacterium shigense]